MFLYYLYHKEREHFTVHLFCITNIKSMSPKVLQNFKVFVVGLVDLIINCHVQDTP